MDPTYTVLVPFCQEFDAHSGIITDILFGSGYAGLGIYEMASRLERPQEVDDVLLLPSGQPIETVDDSICLAIVAPVGFDSLHQIACPSVMQEKDALPDTPERSCSELIRACATLRDAVRKTSTHVVDQEVGEEIHSLV